MRSPFLFVFCNNLISTFCINPQRIKESFLRNLNYIRSAMRGETALFLSD